MDIYGILWIFMDIYMDIDGNLHVLVLWGLGSWDSLSSTILCQESIPP